MLSRMILLSVLVWCFSGLAEQEVSVSFSRDVQPILQRSCAGCHKPGKLKGGLDVTGHDTLMRGGDSGPAVRPGNPKESLLIQSVTGTPPEMPEEGEPLNAQEIDLLVAWVQSGAKHDSAIASGVEPAVVGPVVGPKDESASRIQPGNRPGSNGPPIYHSIPAVAAIAYGPDGTLAVAGHREVLLYDAGGVVVARLVGQRPRIDSIAFSPDGKHLAVAACDPSIRSEIQLWDPGTHQLIATHPISDDSLFGVSFSPSGSHLAMGGADRIMRVIEVPGGKEVVRFANHTDWVFGAGFSHDGTLIVSGSRDSSLRVVEAGSGRFIGELTPNSEPILALAVHPTAPQVVYGGERGGVRVYKMDPKEGFKDPGDNKLHIRDYDHLGGAVYAVAYSRDGRWVAVGGNRDEVRVHQSDNGHRIATLRGHRGAIYSCAFHPSGDRIATAGIDGLIRIYKLPSGELLQNFPSVPLSPASRAMRR